MAQSYDIVKPSLLNNHGREHLNSLKPQNGQERLMAEKLHKPALKSTDSQTQRLDSLISVNWDSSASQWVNNKKEEYTYDLAYLADDLILPDWLNDFSHNKITGDAMYQYDDSNWQDNSVVTLYYSEDVTTSVSESKINYAVYPNPATKFVTFDISELTIDSKVDIFTVQGKKMLSQLLNNNTVDTSNMPKGIYLYQLYIDSEI
jgi:hypothetical protein